MSTAKRVRRSQGEAQRAAPPAATPNKRPKTSHVPSKSGLAFLVNEDARAGKKLDANLTNGVSRARSTRVDESHANVAQDTSGQGEAEAPISISSREEDSSELAHDDEADAADSKDVALLTNGHASDDEDGQANGGAGDAEMADAEETASAEEQTFGDMLQARHPDPIDVSKWLPANAADSHSLAPANRNSSLMQSGHSLGTVLVQALKNNDKDLLESCFATVDHSTIRLTIQRIKSRDVASLLEKIAERIHKRPGRTGNLMVWVQWSLVTHGGYLASQPELMKKLNSLSQVVRERANGLQPLLHLKGKLDLLSAQLELRRGMQDASRALNSEDLDDPRGVLYIEGRDDDFTSDDEANNPQAGNQSRRRIKAKQDADDDEVSDDDDEMGGELPTGVALDDDEDSSDDGDTAEHDGMVDIEAEEGESGDEEEADSDEEVDSDAGEEDDDEGSEGDDDEGDSETVKTPKANLLNRKR
ncbi:U3 small nucleolar RNA-associated protein 5 [Fulvia fulva]|uniref:U3 small nucleolar RNA-associated protein 5 n=1 Tax=Passalora fulva TaxID=5499 RepID=A0A9Q8P4I1_PASFU|nr:U3 small nucleolar RNA-associated protein 5 [Fulvia fulva]KAK4635384.1 U3 small nucleolar RNA-associated protein 5 [Fulvia fulva]KAK4636969.1 U3 small nucleolar RNA-associated protein 5 [Fulvia fulva]UJO12767.1 U3 small nucleolar RNA-associated protein 5 [Fulvia fulva]WPV09522.1 U3 small nucleolar RNA-associated protein 5 [Fulvia fulva]WPV23369.1 U3 small nucleolar RNA-associated protein 5 [Fulvia fulva]